MKSRYLLPILPYLFSPLAFADDCDNAKTQTDMNQCAARQNQAADKALNDVYRQISQRLKASPAAKKQLVSAQRAWLVFRDAECTFSASGVTGGSAWPLVYADCLKTQNIARTQALKGYLACEEGDLSCPVPRQ